MQEADKFLPISVYTKTAKEAECISSLLKEQNLHTYQHNNAEGFVDHLDKSSLFILTKETLSRDIIIKIVEYCADQPSWCRTPVILLLDANELNSKISEDYSLIENLILIEKPIHNQSLLSIIRNCLKNQNEIEKNQEELNKATRAKTDFLSNMSHEIRTPLGAIMGFSELICQARANHQEREEFAQIIKRNGQQLSSIIDDILDLVKIESGQLNIDETESSLDHILSEVLGSLQFRALLKDIPIFIEKAPNVPNHLKTDPVRLKQILTNLISNALKFTTEGQIKVKISLINLISATDYDQKLVFDIIDTGIGIAAEHHTNLFQAFFQADGSVTRKYGGTGLGLALSRQLARALGGDLKLKCSTLGQGSTFQFSIHYSPSEKTLNPLFKKEKTPLEPLKGLKVLVADDSVDNQTLLARMLTKEGAEVELADDGQEAVSKALQQNYNVVLMDVQMPKLSGLEATAKLREQGYPKPIIAVSAYAMEEDREQGLSAGCDLYLTKPIDKSKLLQLLQSYNQH